MSINRRSPLPLYRQLAEIIQGKIENREYPLGAKIPSEPALVKTYGVGRPTIRQALDLLVREGVVEKKKGAGTYVREKAPEIDLFSSAGTSSAFREKGVALARHEIKPVSLTRVPDGRDNPFAGREAYFFSRLNLCGAEPILLEETYLDPGVFPGLERYDFTSESLSRVVRTRYYAEPVSFRQAFRVAYDRTRAELLGLPASGPVLEVARTINFPDCPAGIYSLLYCRTDRFTFSQTLSGGRQT
ncbi:MAG: GntR family transcriptional regulator [Spirochaetales bacterium]|nr:GntR family transcriptional regulator [Spirochaetales bacterium]